MISILRFALSEIGRRKMKFLVGALAFTLSIAFLVMLMSALSFAQVSQNNILTTTGTHFVVYTPFVSGLDLSVCDATGCIIEPVDKANEGFVADNVYTQFTSAEILNELRLEPSIRDASPILQYRFHDSETGSKFTVAGIDTVNTVSVSTTACNAMDITEGRYFSQGETGKAIISRVYSKTTGLGVGDTVEIAYRPYQVIGVLEPLIRPITPDLYISYTDAQEVVRTRLTGAMVYSDFCNIIAVEVRNAAEQVQAMDTAQRLMANGIVSSYNCYLPAAEVLGMNQAYAILTVGIVFLFVVLFLIRAQISSIIERKRGIAILKAIGWSNRDVSAQIAFESCVQSLAGGALGCIIAVILLRVLPMNALLNIQTTEGITISWLAVGVGIAVSFAVGLIVSIVPSVMIMRQRPLEILRNL